MAQKFCLQDRSRVMAIFYDSVFNNDLNNSNQIIQVDLDGNVKILAGNGNRSSTDGNGTDASFDRPNGIGIT